MIVKTYTNNSLLPLFIGCVLIAFGMFFLIHTFKDTWAYQKTTGQIIEIMKIGAVGRKSSTTYAPIIRFNTPDAQTHIFQSRIHFYPNPYRVGQDIQIIYDPIDPTNASVYNIFNLLIVPLFFVGIGIISIIFAIFQKRKNKQITLLNSTK